MASMKPQILVLHNIPLQQAGIHIESETGVLAEVEAVTKALGQSGYRYRVAAARSLQEVPGVIAAGDESIVFNLVEGFTGHPEHANAIPNVVESMGRICTGSPSSALSLALDKHRTKAVLAGAGLPVPQGILIPVGSGICQSDVPIGPCIVKPVCSDASEGIYADRSCYDGYCDAMEDLVRDIHREFHQAVLIEQLVGTRELNVSVIQRNNIPEVLAVAEISFEAVAVGAPRIVDYAAKWQPDSDSYMQTPRILPAPLTDQQQKTVESLALRAWEAIGCRDYARIDFRMDDEDHFWVLEVNPNPDIAPDAGFSAAVSEAGSRYKDFVANCIKNARVHLPKKIQQRKRKPAAGGIVIRPSEPGDRSAILSMLESSKFFRQSEITVAEEVLDEALAAGLSGHYQSYSAEYEGRTVGWVCYGKTPCCVGTFDVYWLVVDPIVQGRQIGGTLMGHVETLIGVNGGRLIVLETAGNPTYKPTRQFYLGLGYEETARIDNFYDVGDDKVIFTKPIRN